MLAKLIDWSASNRFLVLLATVFIVFAGVFAGVVLHLRGDRLALDDDAVDGDPRKIRAGGGPGGRSGVRRPGGMLAAVIDVDGDHGRHSPAGRGSGRLAMPGRSRRRVRTT